MCILYPVDRVLVELVGQGCVVLGPFEVRLPGEVALQGLEVLIKVDILLVVRGGDGSAFCRLLTDKLFLYSLCCRGSIEKV